LLGTADYPLSALKPLQKTTKKLCAIKPKSTNLTKKNPKFCILDILKLKLQKSYKNHSLNTIGI